MEHISGIIKRMGITMTHYDRFDIVDAHYWFCVDYHTGQWSQLYARQCRISRYFKPSILARGPATENAQAIYDNLVAREVST